MQGRDVVITGMGLISPLGRTASENWQNMKAMKTGISHYPREGMPAFLEYLGKVTELALPGDIPQKITGQLKFLNRGALLGFAAAHEATAAAAVQVSDISPSRRSLYVASGDFTKVGYDFLYPAIRDASGGSGRAINFEKLNEATLGKVNPFFLLESLSNNLFSFLSAYLECMGPNTSLASLSPCGGYAIELACRSIRHNRSDIAVAVGYGNWISDIPLYEIRELGIISRCRDGIHSFRPFDHRRDGFITGEGGATLVLEAAESAAKRGVPILGRIRSTANCIEFTSASGFTVPPMVSRRCIGMALESSGSTVRDLAFITPHGSGTQKGDSSELQSMAKVFEEAGTQVPVCGMKSYTGHLGAASDIAEVVLGLLAVKEGIAPATLNFREGDPAYAGLMLAGRHQPSEKRQFLSTSYGVGGQSSSVVVEAV
ncbi:MAG: beta-ketoacyl synthase N-terminal-like domain-containing protein [Thermodesulfovibrionales bacterium]